MKILAIAYSCEPDKGSEPGAGWTWVQMLASFADVHVITRENNRPSIEQALPGIPGAERLTFEYFDLPKRWRRWKKGGRGVRLYYILWQTALARRLRKSGSPEAADLVWHLTMANIWLGSAAPLLGRPYILGPVGGGPTPPLRLVPDLGPRGVAYEVVRAAMRGFARFLNPLARLAWRRAEIILVQNRETKRWLPARYRSRALLFQHAVAEEVNSAPRERSEGPPRAMYAGRLVGWKGVALAIRAIGQTPDWRLTICGTGPDQERFETLVKDEGLEERVSFVGWKTRSEVESLMKDADVFILPSYHDDSPLAVVEAMSAGLPVVCLDVGGPPLLAGEGGRSVTPGSLDETVDGLAKALEEARDLRSEALTRAEELLMSNRAVELERLARSTLNGQGVVVEERPRTEPRLDR